jgi:hypothetical protein
MSKYSIYIARIMSACCFYLFLTKANTWLDKTDNMVMVFGYRSFILLAPLFLVICKRWMTFFAFFISSLGVIFWFYNQNLLGAILFSAGMAVGGYVLKYQASKSANGAANNRIAMNIGGMLSGVVIAIPANNSLFLWLGMGMLIITLISVFISQEKSNENNDSDEKLKQNFSFSELKNLRGISWAIIGIVTVIKIVGLTSVLPQYLIHYYGFLPNWYGLAISLNCIAVIILQKPIMHFMQKFNLNQAISTLLLGMVLISFPGAFFCQTFTGAMLWVFVLTLFECAVSYIDIFSRNEGGLFIKEFFVGVGMAITIFVMRSLTPEIAALILGMAGFFSTLLAMGLFRQNIHSEILVAEQ